MPIPSRTGLVLAALFASTHLAGACSGSERSTAAPEAVPAAPQALPAAPPAAPPTTPPAAQPPPEAPTEPPPEPSDEPVSCATQIARAAFAIVRSNQACTKSEECTHVDIPCVDCGAYLNKSAAEAVAQAAREAVSEPCKCHRGKTRCPAVSAACVANRCMYRKQ